VPGYSFLGNLSLKILETTHQQLAANPLLLYNNVNIGIDDRVNGTLSSEDVSSDNKNAALTIEARRLRAGYRRILHEEGFSYNQNSVDSLNNCLSEAEDEEEDEQDDEEDDEEDDEDEEDDDPFDAPVHQEPTIKRKRANPNYTKRWLEFLQSQENDKIFSPRVNAIISTISEIRAMYPGEKIIVASSSVMFLDIVKEGMKRREDMLPGLKICAYNGSMGETERVSTVNRFNNAPEDYNIMLLSAAAGGKSLNLAGASQLVISEPFWSPGAEEQVHGRPHRIPQKLPLHI
jgi:hypothetical protein